MKISPHQYRIRATMYCPRSNDLETDPSKDKNPESGYGQVKSQVETLAKKLCIMKGSNAHRSVDLDSLTKVHHV